MVMPHPLLPVGLPPAGVAMAMNQMSQLSGLANMAAMSQVQEEEEESKVRGSVKLTLSPELMNSARVAALHIQTSGTWSPSASRDANTDNFALQSPPGTPSPSPSPSDDDPHLQEATSQSPSRASSSLLSSPPPPAHTPELGQRLQSQSAFQSFSVRLSKIFLLCTRKLTRGVGELRCAAFAG